MRKRGEGSGPRLLTYTCTHIKGKRKRKNIYSGPSSLCRFPLLGFSLIQPFGLFAVFANFLLSQKQIEMSLELMYTRTSLTSLSNIFHMCANLAGRQLPWSQDDAWVMFSSV